MVKNKDLFHDILKNDKINFTRGLKQQQQQQNKLTNNNNKMGRGGGEGGRGGKWSRRRKATFNINTLNNGRLCHSSGAVWESRWPSWAVRPN